MENRFIQDMQDGIFEVLPKRRDLQVGVLLHHLDGVTGET